MRQAASSGQRSPMGASLDLILQDLEQMDSEVAAIRAKHQTFLEDKELYLKLVHPTSGQPQLQAEGHRSSAVADKKKSSSPPAASGSPRAASKDAAAARELDPPPSSARSRQQNRRMLTPAQMRAMSNFGRIDTGKVSREKVFHSVPGAEQRLQTRLEYFRHREEQVTKRVEIYTEHLQTGEAVIDVFKLLRAPRLGLRRASDSTAGQAFEEVPGDPEEEEEEEDPGRMASPPSCLPEALESLVTAQSAAEKATGLDAANRRRDVRAGAVREHGRLLQLERRLQLLDDQQHKASRKATADRDRVLLGWVAAAIAAETMHRLRRTYAQVATVGGSGGEAPADAGAWPGLSTQGYWRQAIKRSLDGAALAPPLQRALAAVFRRQSEQDRRALLRQNAQRAWRRAAAVARFLVAIQRRARWNEAADVVKDFLEAAEGENKTMHAMKAYLRKIRMMQRCLRAALRFRKHVCKYIYLPTVWEVETRILGKALGVNQRTLDDEIDGHRRAWDREQRERDAQALGDARFPQIHRPKRSSECGSVAGSVGGRRLRNQVIISPHGRALGYNKKIGLGDDVEQHRLSVAERTIIVNGLLRQGTTRYWLARDDYVFAMREHNIEWQQWKLEAQSLGPEFRDSWPPFPVAPLQPAEVMKLDMPPLRDKVLSLLKIMKAGHLF